MKKGWKIFGIICAVMAGLGFVLCIAGFAIGVSAQEVRDVLENGIGITPYSMYKNHKVTTVEKIEMDGAFEERFDSRFIRDIEMEVGNVQVEVIATEGKEIIVEHNVDEHLKFKCYADGTTLNIETGANGKHGNHEGVIRVHVPKSLLLNEVDLSIGAGTLAIEDLSTRELNLSCGAASAHMMNISADNVDIECGAGQIEYVVNGQETDYNYDIAIGAGEVSIGENVLSGLAVDKKIHNKAHKKMSIECGAGQVAVSFEQ